MENLCMCAKCGGTCCKNVAGLYSKDQVPNWRDNIEATNNLEVVYLPIFSHTILRDVDDPNMISELSQLTDRVLKYMPALSEKLEKDGVVILWAVRPSSKDPSTTYKVQYYKSLRKGKGCVHHTMSGCNLEHMNRPKQCRDLVPKYANGRYVCGENDYDSGVIKLFATWQPVFAELQEYAISSLYIKFSG